MFWQKKKKRRMQIPEYQCPYCEEYFLKEEWERETKRDRDYIEGSLPDFDKVMEKAKIHFYLFAVRCPGCKKAVFINEIQKR